ncbi:MULTISPECIES: outer membrane protein [Providencia]|uniref:Porin opacity type n=1 Tax=Providencia heimbachae ATCC 35613 TaxID=1354272 RepID=A0A1B7JZV7_9GAMM|nr:MULTISPECIES: outer membrane protein [Providencia]MBP6121043.1 porin family protein [Providencia sp.]MDD9338483.1 porin family protein [Providencia heimbachae]NIH23585.1 porin family protein [Providencia heimbachae]OAT53429.1 porin opacity type [Providencia heimbachae ATCC 35613]QCJ71046.1 porin family protein [Providencia heimbachae]
MNKYIVISIGLALSGINSVSLASTSDEGYYGAARIMKVWQKADSMDTSSRPGIGQFVSGNDKENFYNGAIAAGYQYGNGWRTEAEYTFKKKAEYTSGSSMFPTSLNHHKTDTQRLMLNAYRDYEVYQGVSLYGTVGLGIAKVKSSGWQGNASRQYGSNTDTNLAYSVGAGISYEPIDKLNFDLGYRYIDLGKIESGMNNFDNIRKHQDEQMKAHLKSQEVMFGVRYLF